MARESISRSEAQGRADQIQVFATELACLEREGILKLDASQRAAVAAYHDGLLADLSAHHDIDRSLRAKQLSWGMKVASFLGALALAASVFFLFRQFWGLLPTAAQVAVLIGAALGSFAATLWIRGRDSHGYFTKLAALVAFACFVLDLAMLGQIFSITPSDKALIAWGVMALLLAYACDLRLLLAAGILCLVAFLSARTGTWMGLYWLDFGERPENFFPAALLLCLVPVLWPQERYAGFAPVYRVFGLLTLFLSMLVLANWGSASYLELSAATIARSYQVAGFLASGIAIWLGIRRGWSDMANTGIVFFVIFLYTKFFDWWWQTMPKYLFFLVLGLTAVLLLVVLRRLRQALLRGDGGGAR